MVLAPVLTHLTHLELNHCREITDAGVTALAGGLTTLTHLNLNCCQQITDRGVTALAEGLTALTSLDLGMNDKLNDAGMMALVHLTFVCTCGWGFVYCVFRLLFVSPSL
jgi:hypothetical protein